MSIASVFSMKPFQKLWKYTDRGGDDSENIPGVRTNEWDECIIIIKNSLYCSVHFTGFARSFHFIPFTRFTDSLACSVHFIHFTHRASRRFRSFHSPGSVHFIHFTDTNSYSSSYHHSPASPACPRLHLSPQTGTTPSVTCPFQTAGCPA